MNMNCDPYTSNIFNVWSDLHRSTWYTHLLLNAVLTTFKHIPHWILHSWIIVHLRLAKNPEFKAHPSIINLKFRTHFCTYTVLILHTICGCWLITNVILSSSGKKNFSFTFFFEYVIVIPPNYPKIFRKFRKAFLSWFWTLFCTWVRISHT